MQDEPLILTVDKNGHVSCWRASRCRWRISAPSSIAIFDATPDKEIFLRADKEAPYGLVVKAMAVAREAGCASSLGIVTEPE